MKMTDYPSVQNIVENNIFLLDGPQGTKIISAKHLADELSKMSGGSTGGDINLKNLSLADASDITPQSRILLANSEGDNKALELEDAIFSLLDPIIGREIRSGLWRGKNLGNSVNEEIYDGIASGSFKGIFLGDYWEIDDKIWRIVDFDYWYGSGASEYFCYNHHVLIMPDSVLYMSKMNNTETTDGAYLNSYMYKTGLNEAKKLINNTFGEIHVMKHGEILQNATTKGYASGGIFVKSTVEIPDELMIFGTYMYSNYGDGTSISNRYFTGRARQVKAFAVNPELITQNNITYWLRNVASEKAFCAMSGNGQSRYLNPTTAYGVRPYFALCKETEYND